jgi:hypothetical protein
MPRVRKFSHPLLIRITESDKSLFDQAVEQTDLSPAELSRRALRLGVREIRRRGVIGSPPKSEVTSEK